MYETFCVWTVTGFLALTFLGAACLLLIFLADWLRRSGKAFTLIIEYIFYRKDFKAWLREKRKNEDG